MAVAVVVVVGVRAVVWDALHGPPCSQMGQGLTAGRRQNVVCICMRAGLHTCCHCLDRNAGALIAFIFPAWIALRAIRCRDPTALASQVGRWEGSLAVGVQRCGGAPVTGAAWLAHLLTAPAGCRQPGSPPLPLPQGYWTINAWALIAIGIAQAVAGVTATLFFSHKDSGGQNGARSAALAAALF